MIDPKLKRAAQTYIRELHSSIKNQRPVSIPDVALGVMLILSILVDDEINDEILLNPSKRK